MAVMQMYARYPGTCAGCQQPYAQGVFIAWSSSDHTTRHYPQCPTKGKKRAVHMPAAGPVRVTKADGSVQVQPALGLRQRRAAASGQPVVPLRPSTAKVGAR